MQTNEIHLHEQAAIEELTIQWGYRDISTFIEDAREHTRQQYFPEIKTPIPYLCVLQTPRGGPVYCKTTIELFCELEEARNRNEPYATCPAPDSFVDDHKR